MLSCCWLARLVLVIGYRTEQCVPTATSSPANNSEMKLIEIIFGHETFCPESSRTAGRFGRGSRAAWFCLLAIILIYDLLKENIFYFIDGRYIENEDYKVCRVSYEFALSQSHSSHKSCLSVNVENRLQIFIEPIFQRNSIAGWL